MLEPRIIVFTGPSGVGKSTAAAFCKEIVPAAEIVKAARPIYQMQRRVYEHIGIDLAADVQDPILLSAIAQTIEREKPRFLAEELVSHIRAAIDHGHPLIVCDDLRRNAESAELYKLGALVVEVSGPIRTRHSDRISAYQSPEVGNPVDVAPVQTPSHYISNAGNLDDLRVEIQKILCP